MIAKDDCVSVLTHSDSDGDHLSFQCTEKNIEIQKCSRLRLVYNKQHKNTTCVCHEYVM